LKSFSTRSYLGIGAPAFVVGRVLYLPGEEVAQGVGFIGEDSEVSVGVVDDKLERMLDQFRIGPIFCALDSDQLLCGGVIDTGLKYFSSHHFQTSLHANVVGRFF
jgi:hypothetical protein